MNMLPTGSLQILRGGRYVIRRILHRYNPPKTPLRYLAQTATLSGANRYAIRRESFQVHLLITWLGNWIFLNKIDYFSTVFGEGTRSTVLAQDTIPM